MKKSYISILLLFLVMILAISAASAAEIDDTSDSVVQAADVDAVDEIATADVDDAVAASDDGADVVADVGDKNFTVLQEKITNDGVVILDSNYVRAENEKTIEIESDAQVIGNGAYTIDANNLGGIFKVNSGAKLVLVNVILINGKVDDKGGAIYNEGTLTISGSTLENNTAAAEGGAIYSTGTLVVSETDFNKNTVTNNYNAGGSEGAAIAAIGGKLDVINSNFNENSACPSSWGCGAIYANHTTVSIRGSTFKKNQGFFGGAIFLENIDQDTAAIEGSKFIENSGLQGGAINIQTDTAGTVIINDCEFTSNSVYSTGTGTTWNDGAAGGAIQAANGDINLVITDSTFTGNTVDSPYANAFGGALRVNGDLTVDGCTFTGNKVTSESKLAIGSAISVGGVGTTTTITNTEIKDSEAQRAAVYVWYNTANIDNVTFTNNIATTEDGGALYYIGTDDGKLTVTDSTFTSNKGKKGGAVYVRTGTADITGTTFTDNEATVQGGAIYSTGTLNVDDSTFTGNKITEGSVWKAEVTNGGAGIYTGEGSSLTVTKSNFTSNTGVAAYNVYTLGGGIFVNQAESVLIDTCKFDSNVVGQGGAVAFEDFSQTTDAITGCEFNNNKAWQGGAVNINTAVENLIISDSTFTGNQAIEPDLGDASTMGGAIIIGTRSTVSTNVEINGCNFTGNDGGKFGGAVMIGGNSSATIDDCDFKENTATTLGGAICNDGKAIDNVITNSNFEKNNAGSMGGAVFLGTYAGTGISNSVFTENTATNHGNAVCTYAETELTNNTFSDETADVKARGTGEIITNWIVTVMDGKDYFVNFNQIKLYANVTDDNGNLIELTNAKFTFNGEDVIDATWNATSKLYEALYTPTTEGTYVVSLNVEGDHVDITTATIRFTRTLSDLANKIASADAGDTIDLDANYTYIEEFDSAYVNGIVIDKALTINGNNHIISGNDAVRVFNVTAGTLTLNNVTISNGNASEGGAIYVNAGAALDADYVNFINNTATYKGGAVYSEGDVKVNHTVFDSNNIIKRDGSASDNYGGAAIYNVDGALTVDNSVFKNNLKDYKYGITEDNGDKVTGAITTTGTVRITNSNFTSNKGRYGSSITMNPLTSIKQASIVLDNCNFTDNIAYQGGAVNFNDGIELEFTINNCWFENNAAYGKGSGGFVANGGALNAEISHTVGKGTINGTTFINNQVQDVTVSIPGTYVSGGAVMFNGKQFTVENSVFINNTAERGSAIHTVIIEDGLTVDNVTFDSNKATVGGAIWAYDNIYVRDSRFINNDAAEGGAIYFTKFATASTITNSNFTDNNATNGGAIYIAAPDDSWKPAVTITDSKFDGNTATGEGNAIYNDGKLTLARNTLSKQQADIVSNGEVASTIIIKVMNNGTAYHFANITLQANVTDDSYNVMAISGLYLKVNDTANTLVAVEFNPETQLHEGIYTPIEVGKFNIGVTYITTSNLDITDANITISRSLIDIQDMVNAANAGDTINLTGDYAYIEEFDSEIVNGIVVNKTITIDGKGFTISGSNAARIFNITNNAVLTLTNAALTEGNATDGGAVYVNAGSTLKADNVNFDENTATYRGGAIWSEGDVNIDNSAFDSNDITYRKANEDYGGAAIYNNGNLTVNHSNFTNNLKNYVVRTGDANNPQLIDGVVLSTGVSAVVNNSRFENNNGTYGGAISALPMSASTLLIVENSEFTNNLAYCGAAIYVGTGLTYFDIRNSTFIGNNATGKGSTNFDASGGAIRLTRGANGNITDSKFYNNVAAIGGAVSVGATKNSVKLTIDNCDFKDNAAVGSSTNNPIGGAIYIHPDKDGVPVDVAVKNSNFTTNVAADGGSAIYSDGILSLSGNNVTSGNAEIEVGAKGFITSTIKVTILDGEVKTIETLEAKLSAKVTDDKDNLIKDAQFKFTINDVEVAAVYNAANKLYEATYTLPSAGIYPVNITYASDDELEVENATVKSIYGTFTQLQQLIDNATDTLVLPYNFTYNAEIDGDALKAGVVINKALTVDGNGSTISGADAARIFQLNKDNIKIKNTTFTNGYSNTSSTKTADWGGAIYSNAPYSNHAISDCKFYNNTAYKGGAIYLASDASEIVACEFEDNNANASGGAVFINGLADTISDSTFKFNMANELGGAVACYSTQQAAEIKNSVFIGNSAFVNGGAVYVNGGAKLNITKSVMKNNTANVGSSIYSNGTIVSFVNATILDNKTWNDTGLGDLYVLNATLTDDMGNNIYDPNFRFTVDGTEIADEPLYYDETGLYTLGYVVEKAGLNVVSTSYNAQVFTGALDIPLANVTKFTVFAIDILEGKNATVFVTLIGVNDIRLNATVTVIVNNKEYPDVLVKNGTGNITIEDLTHGQYPVVAMFKDPNYEYTINSTVFNVKGQAVLNITELTTAVYGDEIEITINLTDSKGNPLSGVVVVDDVINVLVENGIGTFTIDNQPDVGKYSFQAVYYGDNDYFGNLTLFNVTVTAKELNQSKVEFSFEGDYDNGLNITIKSPVDGNYTVDINGTNVTVEVVNGTGSAIAKLDKPDDYTAVITLNDENYSLKPIEYDVVYKGAPDFTVEISGTYPNAEIRIFGTPGTYHVNIDEFDTINITVNESRLGVAPIGGIAAGNYTASVSYDANDKYREDYKEVNFTIDKASSNVTIGPIETVVYGTPVVIKYNITNETDCVTISISKLGSDIPEEYVASEGTITANLTAGKYIIRIHNAESDDFNESEDCAEFTVEKAEALTITVNGEIGVMGAATVNVTVADDATGYVVVDNDGVKEVYELVNGSCSFEIYDLQAGEYTINVTYLGDDNYNKTEATKVLDIPKSQVKAEITDVTAEIIGGQDATFTVTMNNTLATGTVSIFVDGVLNKVVDLDEDYANATVVISGLGNGTHTIAVQYDGDDNYEALENATTTITVVKAASKVTIEEIENVTLGNSVIIKYSIVNETEFVTISISKVGSDIPEEYVESNGTITAHLPVGTYIVSIHNGENAFYTEDEATATFTVEKADDYQFEVNLTVGEIDMGENLTIDIELPEDANGNVTVYVDGVEAVNATVKGGKATVTVPASAFTKAGYNDIDVTYSDNNYAKTTVSDEIYVNYVPFDLTASADDIEVGQNATIIVNLPENADGYAYVILQGVTYDVVDGKVVIENLTEGTYTATVTFEDDSVYDDNETTVTFNVTKVEVSPEQAFNITVPENSTAPVFSIDLPEDATGYLLVDVDGEKYYAPLVNGSASIETAPLDGGNHTVTVTYTGDDKYAETSVSDVITITTVPVNLTASADDIEVGQNATIIVKLPEGVDGEVYVMLDGVDYDVVDGKVVIENLTEGTYTADVIFVGNGVYEDNETTVTFNVTKVKVSPEQAFNITAPENSTSQVISVNLPEDATGYLLLDINGTQTHVPLVNGKANVTVPNLAEGTYNATITYTGDDKYGPITTTKEINVTSNVPENALNIPDSAKSDEPTTYSISLPSNATGYLEVDVDGTKYVAALNNGSASVTVPALSAGNHNVTVTYTGDANYSPVSKATTLSVAAPVFKLSNNKNVNVVYSAKANYKVLVTRDGKAVGAGQTVTFKFNGKTYTAKTDSKGYATLKLNTKVKVKKYTITATYKGVTVKNTVKVKHLIKAKNKKIKKSKKVNKIKVKTKKVNGKYLKGKKLTLKIKGKKVKAKINKKGVATFKLKKKVTKKLKAGKKYKYTVTYGKDKVTKKVKVKK